MEGDPFVSETQSSQDRGFDDTFGDVVNRGEEVNFPAEVGEQHEEHHDEENFEFSASHNPIEEEHHDLHEHVHAHVAFEEEEECGVLTEEIQEDLENDVHLKEFQQKWQSELERKDENNRTRREEMRINAKKELESFYEERLKKIESNKASNREAEGLYLSKLREAESMNNPWERILSLVNVSSKEQDSQGSDVTRLKNLLIQLKNGGPQAGFKSSS